MRSGVIPCWVLVAASAGAAAAAPPEKVKAASQKSFLEDATDVPAALRKAIPGAIVVYKLTLSEVSAVVDVQDSRKKENIDRYSYDNGAFGKPRPVTMHGRYTQKDLDAAVFPLESIDFSLVPKMIADARQLVAMPDGKTSTLFLQSGRPHRKPHWSVVVANDRHTGFVDFDLKGRKLRASKQ